MSLHLKIKEEIKNAMRAKDSLRLNVMRGISTAFTNELVATGKKPQDQLSDDVGLTVIKRLIKQRKDSIEQFKKGGREDLVIDEQAELAILESFVPQDLSKDQIKKVAEAKKAELRIIDSAKIGILIGAVMKELRGRADGADVKEVVEGLF